MFCHKHSYRDSIDRNKQNEETGRSNKADTRNIKQLNESKYGIKIRKFNIRNKR
jgi:hypothetical protein